MFGKNCPFTELKEQVKHSQIISRFCWCTHTQSHWHSHSHLMTEYIKSKWKQDWIMRAGARSMWMCVYESRRVHCTWRHAHSLHLCTNKPGETNYMAEVCVRVLCLANTVYRPSFINKIVQKVLYTWARETSNSIWRREAPTRKKNHSIHSARWIV